MQSLTPHQTSLFLIQKSSFGKPAFGRSAGDAMTNAAGVIVSTLYDKGPGVRYAVEQTLGYTVPRTFQQLYRDHNITGDVNTQAAKEMLVRDLSADFLDTFAPGLIATYILGRVIDNKHGTMVKHNIEYEAMGFYNTIARNSKGNWVTSRKEFMNELSNIIKQSVGKPDVNFDLAQNLRALSSGSSARQQAILIAEQLGLKDLHIHLQLPKTFKANDGVREWKGALTDLLSDTTHLISMPFQQRILMMEKAATKSTWGALLARGVQKTVSLKRYQMLANFIAVAGSFSIPFIVRALTKRHYGHEAFPGTQQIHKHFESLKKNSFAVKGHPEPGYVPKRFKLFAKLFPYLHHSLEKENIIPTVMSAGFITFLTAMVLRRFKINQASLFKAKDWFRIYKFDRGFPFTSVPQMELSFGLLCWIRLLASRNDAEFRETAFRDCILGFPTLTYFTDWFKPKVMAHFNNRLSQQHGLSNILMRPDNEVRLGQEISPLFYRNMGLTASKASQLAKTAKNYHNWGTLGVAGLSWVLLAWLEPQLGIWLTNYFELNRYQPQSPVQHRHSKNNGPILRERFIPATFSELPNN